MNALTSLEYFKTTVGRKAESLSQKISSQYLVKPNLPRYQDGDLTGPYYPAGNEDKLPCYASPDAALKAGAVVFVNGIRNTLEDHVRDAQTTADRENSVAVGVYNESDLSKVDRITKYFGPTGFLLAQVAGSIGDLAQSLSDDEGDYLHNPAIATLLKVINKHPNQKIIGHSQGSLIVLAALRERQEQGKGHDDLLGGYQVKLFGSPAATRPLGFTPVIDTANNDDVVSSFGMEALARIRNARNSYARTGVNRWMAQHNGPSVNEFATDEISRFNHRILTDDHGLRLKPHDYRDYENRSPRFGDSGRMPGNEAAEETTTSATIKALTGYNVAVKYGSWAEQLGRKAGQWGSSVAGNAHRWLGSKKDAASHWLGGKAHTADHWLVARRTQIGLTLHQGTALLARASRSISVAAAGLAKTGGRMLLAAPFRVLSLTLGAASAAARMWHSVTASVNRGHDQSASGKTHDAETQAARRLALALASVEHSGARAFSEAGTLLRHMPSLLHDAPHTTPHLHNALHLLTSLPRTGLGSLFHDHALTGHLKIGSVGSKAAKELTTLGHASVLHTLLRPNHPLRTASHRGSHPDVSGSASTGPTGTGAQLAARVLANPHIRLAGQHVSRVKDEAAPAGEMVGAASGHAASRSHYENAPGGAVDLDPRMLSGMLGLAHDYSFTVSEIAGGSHSKNSRHYAGIAFDVSTINGRPVSSQNTDYQAFMAQARQLGATEVLGPGDSGHSGHVHVGWPRTAVRQAPSHEIAGRRSHHAILPPVGTPASGPGSLAAFIGERASASNVHVTSHAMTAVFPARAARRQGGGSTRGPSPARLARKAQFQNIASAATRAGDAHPEITAAQWALESGWGAKVTGTSNFFGQKAKRSEPGSMHPTHEQVGGKIVPTTARFRDYPSLDEGVADHVRRWNSKEYASAATDVEAIGVLQKHHYATDTDYAGKILPIIQQNWGGGASKTRTSPAKGTLEAARPGQASAGGFSPLVRPMALQRKGTGDHPDVNPAALRFDLRKQSGGFTPDGGLRERLGGHLGFDPGGARLHTGPAAAQASRALNAEAFTIGSDVFFGEGRFDPHTPKGLGLIAHELTHVGQQTGTTGSKARFFTERGGDEMEREAQQTGERVLANAGSRSGLFVEDYVREYEGEGGLTQADQQRLDRISVMALDEAQRLLTSQGVRGSVNADALDVSVEIDLGEMSDGEAARVWAEAIIVEMPQSQQAAEGLNGHHQQPQASGLQRSMSHDSVPPPGVAPMLASTPASTVSGPTVPMRNFVHDGKSQLVTEEEYQHLVAEANRRLSIRLGLVESGAEDGKKIQEDFMNDTHRGFSGLFGKASDLMGGVKPPAPAIWERPKPPIASGREALQGLNLTAATSHLILANKRLAQSQGQWHDYINGTISGGETGIEIATVVRDTSFSIAVGSAAIVAAPFVAGGLAAAGAGTALTAVGTTAAVTVGGGAMGAGLRSGSEVLGEASSNKGHVDWHNVRHEAWEGAKHGSVDAATSVIGMGVGRVGANFVRPGLETLGSRAIRGAVTGGVSGGIGGFLNAIVTPPVRRKEDGPESWGNWAKRVGMSTMLGAGGGALGSVGNELLAGATPGTVRRMFAAGTSNAISGGGTATAQEAMDAHREHRKFNRNAVYQGAITSGVSSGLQAGASGAYRTRNSDGTRRIVSMQEHNQRFDQAFKKASAGRQLMSKTPAPTADASILVEKPIPIVLDEFNSLKVPEEEQNALSQSASKEQANRLQEEARVLDGQITKIVNQLEAERQVAQRDDFKADLYGRWAEDKQTRAVQERIQQLRDSAEQHRMNARLLDGQAAELGVDLRSKIQEAQKHVQKDEIANPFGTQKQGSREIDIAVKEEILTARKEGKDVKLYAIGSLGKSYGIDRQFYMYEDPRLPGVADNYALPPENLKTPDMIVEIILKPDAEFVTKKVNDYKYKDRQGKEVVKTGEGVEIVILPGGGGESVVHASAPGDFRDNEATTADIKRYSSVKAKKAK